MQRAFVEAIVLGLACGPLGVWILLLRRAYAAESLSHAMLPGLVIAALVGRAADRSARPAACSSRRSGSRSWRATRGPGETSASRSSSPACSGSAASSRSRPRRRRGSASCCSATCSGSPTATSSPPPCSALGVLIALAVGYRALAATAFARGSAQALGIRPARADLALLALLAVTTVAAVQGLGQPAAGRARARARRRRAQPRRSACRAILALAAGLAVVAGHRRARHLLRARDRGRGERRSVRRRTLLLGALETKVRHAII